MRLDGWNNVAPECHTARKLRAYEPGNAIRKLLCALVTVLVAAGCSSVDAIAPDHVDTPLVDRDARAQVIDPLTTMVTAMRLRAVLASFAWESCNDQNDIPFRGRANVNVAVPADLTPVAMRQQIRDNLVTTQEWRDGPPPGKTLYGLALHKGSVMAVLTINGGQTTIPGTISVDVFGECRDTTDHAGAALEPITDLFA